MILALGSALLPNFILLLIGVITIAILYLRHAYSYWSKQKVVTLPIDIPFGNFKPFILQRKFIGHQITYLYDKAKNLGKPYVGLYMMWRPVLLLLDPEMVRIVLSKEFQHFSSRTTNINEKNDPLEGHLVNINGKQWKFMRSKLSPTFSSGKMKMMFNTLLACGNELDSYLNKHQDTKEPLEIKEMMARFTTDIIASCAFGIECNSLKEPDNIFREQGKRIFDVSRWGFLKSLLSSNLPKIAALLKIKRSKQETRNFFMNLVKETVEYREKNNIERNDFMNLLIRLKNKGFVDDFTEESTGEIKKLTLEQIAAQCFVFFIGGFETSSTTLSSIMYELSIHQDIQDKLRVEINHVLNKHGGQLSYDNMMEMTYLDQVIDEAMRLHPVAPLTGRKCVSDFTFPDSKLTIKTGTSIFIPIESFHKDPQYYPNPEIFDPDRFSTEEKTKRHSYVYLPFGAGPRNCIGLRFAMMQMKVGLIKLLKNHRFTLNMKTDCPLKQNPRLMIYNIVGGVWVNVERIKLAQ